MRKVSVIAGVCALVCLLGLFGRSEQTAKASRGAAPQFSLPDAKGAPVKLTDYKGKVVLLNFWATWCHGCVEEIPWFIDFQQKYKDQGLVVVGLSQDDGWGAVNDYVAAKKVNYPVLLDTKHVSDDYDLGGMPMSVLIDRSGRIAAKHVGVVDRSATEAEIKSLLQESAK